MYEKETLLDQNNYDYTEGIKQIQFLKLFEENQINLIETQKLNLKIKNQQGRELITTTFSIWGLCTLIILAIYIFILFS